MDKFFEGEDYFGIQTPYCELGHIWVCKHTGFDTLTIEPKEGGQYEIAVRIFSEGEWKGYRVNNLHNINEIFFVGVNTNGH